MHATMTAVSAFDLDFCRLRLNTLVHVAVSRCMHEYAGTALHLAANGGFLKVACACMHACVWWVMVEFFVQEPYK